MSETGLLKLALGGAIVAALAATGPTALAQNDVKPVNDLPNPYQTISDHFKLPEGRRGDRRAPSTSRDGQSIWVAERCGANSCLNAPDVDPILHFDASGNWSKSFGAGLLIFPHGIHVDRDGNVWVTDGAGQCAAPARGAAAARGGRRPTRRRPVGPIGRGPARRAATRSSSSAPTARC